MGWSAMRWAIFAVLVGLVAAGELTRFHRRGPSQSITGVSARPLPHSSDRRVALLAFFPRCTSG